MADVVGGVAVTVEPDLSGFGAQLAAALGPALAAGIEQISAATGQMAATGETNISALADAIGTQLGDAAATATAALVGDTEQLTLAFDDLATGVAADGGQIVDIVEGVGATITTSIGTAIQETVAEVDVGTSQMVVDLSDVQAAAADVADGADTGRDAMGRFSSQGSDDVLSLADIIKGTAIGSLIADGVEGGVALAVDALGALKAATFDVGGEFVSAFNKIRIGTGDTGVALGDLEQSVRNVAGNTPASLDQISGAITTINQRLGLTGTPLEDLTQGFLRFSRLTGTDLQQNLTTVTGVFNNFGVAAGDQTGKLDELFRVFQNTGVPVATLTSSMSSLGATARLAGLSFEDTAALIGQLNKAGLDGGAVQMAFTKILKKASDDNVDAGTELKKVFAGVKDGTLGMSDAFDLFGPRGVKVFELIKSGTLDYQAFSAQISGGGDTLAQAAADTSTWQGQLGILTNQLKLDLEPVVTFVFNRLTDVVRAVRPVIAELADLVSATLMPVFDGLVSVLTPVWNELDKVRRSFGYALDTLSEGGDIFDAIATFFSELTGDDDVAFAIADALQGVADSLVNVWNALQPVRDAIAQMFDAARDAISNFVADHPTEFLLGLVAALTALVGPLIITGLGVLAGALGAVATTLGGLVVSAAAAAAPFVAIAAAVTAVALAAKWAYDNWQPFHDAVDEAATVIEGTLLTAFHDVSDFVNNDVVPWVTDLPSKIRELWAAFTENETVVTILGGIRDAGAQLADIWANQLAPALSKLWDALGPLVDALGNILRPILEWAIDHWQILLGIWVALQAPLIALAAGAIYLYTHFQVVRDVIQSVVEHLEPFVSLIVSFVGGALQDFINLLTGVVDVLTGLFSLDFGKVVDGLSEIGGAIISSFGNIGELLGGLLQGLGSILADLLRTAVAFVIAQGPGIIEGFLSWVSSIPGWVFDRLLDLGGLLLEAVSAAWDWVVQNGPGILESIAEWAASIPGQLLEWLGDLGSLLGGWLLSAFDWVVSNSVTLLGNLISWAIEIPALIIQAMWNLNQLLADWIKGAFDWIVTNGPGILLGILEWVSALPGKIIGWLGDLGSLLWNWWVQGVRWVVDNGPGIIEALATWVKSLPGMILGWLGDLGGLLIGWIKGAFDWVVTNGPDLLKGLLDWFSGLPGKIFDAIRNGLSSIGGAVTSIASDIWDAIKGFVNEHLIDPAREFKVSILGHDYTPLGGLPHLALGDITSGPQIALIGDNPGGREAVIPLNDPGRAASLADQAGIPRGNGSGNTYIDLTLVVDPADTQEHIQMVMQTAGAALRDVIPGATRVA